MFDACWRCQQTKPTKDSRISRAANAVSFVDTAGLNGWKSNSTQESSQGNLSSSPPLNQLNQRVDQSTNRLANPSANSPGRQRFRSRSRIRTRRDFVRIQSQGVRVSSEHFVFLMVPGGIDAATRMGITITRKVGCAVVRNRAKRLVREAFRQLSASLPKHTDMVIIVRKPLHGLKTPAVIEQWKAVLHLMHRRTSGWSAQ